MVVNPIALRGGGELRAQMQWTKGAGEGVTEAGGAGSDNAGTHSVWLLC